MSRQKQQDCWIILETHQVLIIVCLEALLGDKEPTGPDMLQT